MGDLKGKTVFITGASRGIGKAIGLRAARDGARVVVAAKTTEPHPRLPGTIYSAADEMRAAGGEALAVRMDIRFEAEIDSAVEAAVEAFGGIDILVNNASAIFLAGTLETPMKRYDLMHQVNARGTYATSRACLPHLRRASNPHILNISPPLNVEARWFAPHLAYTMSKFGMSLCTLGMAEELKQHGIAVNSLWPQTTIATAAVRNLLGGEEVIAQSRTPDIMADAAHVILSRDARTSTGRFLVDEEVLREAGVTDLARYAVTPGGPLRPDFFL